MSASKGILTAILVLALCLAGCSHGGNAIVPEAVGDLATSVPNGESPHSLLGLYTFLCNPDSQSIDIITHRDADMHLNALKFLEPPPNVYLRIDGPVKISGGIVDVNMALWNPFLGQKIYTGFDVCGIVFTHGSYSGYNDPEIVTAGIGDTRLLNADGFTRWWNPAEFPHTNTILGYSDGLLGTKSENADFNCTVNGYKLFADGLNADDPVSTLDPAKRAMFSAGMKRIRHYTIDLSGGLIFNYAVDACWKMPKGSPPYDAPDDFPPGANREEAYGIIVEETLNNLYYDDYTFHGGGELHLLAHVYSHFDLATSIVSAESPVGLPYTVNPAPIGGGEDFSTYQFDFIGNGLTTTGDVDLLITVQSESTDYGGLLPGRPVYNYYLHTFLIRDKLGWAVTWGGNQADYPYDIAADSAGNTYAAGFFDSKSVDFDPGPDECIKSKIGLSDAFIVKFDPFGKFQWANTWGGPGGIALVTGVEVDNLGNIYTFGMFRPSIDFDPGPGENLLSSNGENDFFLSKFDGDGSYYWTITWGGPGKEEGFGIDIDEDGNIYTPGAFSKTVDFDPGPGVEERTSPGDSFSCCLSKFDSEGSFNWVVTWEAIAGITSGGGLNEVCVDNVGNIVVAGAFRGTYDLDPGPWVEEHTSYTEDQHDAFICKLNPSCSFLWAASWGGESTDTSIVVDTDNDGNIYSTGWFGYTVDFDPGPGVDEHTCSGGTGTFLSKFDPYGGFEWVRTYDEYGGDALTVDILDTIYISYGQSNFGKLVKFDQQGTELWSRAWGEFGKLTASRGLTTDGNQNVFVAGRFTQTVDFDPGPGIEEHISEGFLDCFIMKFLPTGTW